MKKILGLLLITGLAAGALAAGVVYEIEVTDHGQSPPRTEDSRMSAEGKNLKMGVSAGERGGAAGEMIFRGDRREMVIVDHDDESYTVIDEQAIESVAGQVGAMMAQMQEALKNVPEGQRAAVEEMMKKRMPQEAPARPRREVRRTGEHGDKAGYPCVKYEVLRDGRVVQELWVTDWNNLEGSAEVRQLFGEMAAFFKEMMDAFAGAAGELGGLAGGLGDNMFDLFDRIDGFPAVTRDLDADGSLDEESTLRSARRQDLDPEEFEPPAGYKRRTLFGG